MIKEYLNSHYSFKKPMVLKGNKLLGELLTTINHTTYIPGVGLTDVEYVTDLIGVDYLANVGGAIHSHMNGTLAGTLAMRQAIDKDYGNEYAAHTVYTQNGSCTQKKLLRKKKWVRRSRPLVI